MRGGEGREGYFDVKLHIEIRVLIPSMNRRCLGNGAFLHLRRSRCGSCLLVNGLRRSGLGGIYLTFLWGGGLRCVLLGFLVGSWWLVDLCDALGGREVEVVMVM